MSRAQTHKISKDKKRKIVGELFEIVTSLRTKKETIGFLIGLLSPSEMLMLSRRIQIAKMLLDDKNYRDISNELHVGQGTVSSVARWLYDENNVLFKQQIIKQHKQGQKTKSKKYYNNILSPYGQLNALKDIINSKM